MFVLVYPAVEHEPIYSGKHRQHQCKWQVNKSYLPFDNLTWSMLAMIFLSCYATLYLHFDY